MAQIRESKFVVRNKHEDDIDLVDLAGGGGVIVETEHEYYDSEMEDRISGISEGDIIRAMIQGEDILQPNSIWRFLELETVR